ncbi:uncharacterized protein AMSG_01786 [Thecamonas trahens ATCC 50062]|uniref:Uncharacterized protein n=1 Tax=Thecamonas trahens ATCC 50062 TaxID=461836 RepID=A0A0L0DTZ4_THETB|nr:hypothetical protein AMSG_01786 [Thecamonas trahens ATCC 50062]KNC55521.1 hypothetical protein AMSG_01786 [Thecamonas trahens ATCC 50062]|eukprot:XP_013761299.1 hypothetical protein AMSG_01786 [Thecamonas trahens ATCC 50062]
MAYPAFRTTFHTPSPSEARAEAAKATVGTGRYRPPRADVCRPELPGPNSPLARGHPVLSYAQAMYEDEARAALAKVVSPKPWIAASHSPDAAELAAKAAKAAGPLRGRYRPPRADVCRPDLPGPNSPLARGHPVLSYAQEMYEDEARASLDKLLAVHGPNSPTSGYTPTFAPTVAPPELAASVRASAQQASFFAQQPRLAALPASPPSHQAAPSPSSPPAPGSAQELQLWRSFRDRGSAAS